MVRNFPGFSVTPKQIFMLRILICDNAASALCKQFHYECDTEVHTRQPQTVLSTLDTLRVILLGYLGLGIHQVALPPL